MLVYLKWLYFNFVDDPPADSSTDSENETETDKETETETEDTDSDEPQCVCRKCDFSHFDVEER